MTQVREDLEAAQSVLEVRGWCQGDGADPDGKVCLEGAVAAVTFGDPHLCYIRGDGQVYHEVYGGFVEFPAETVARHLAAINALKAQLPDSHNAVYAWNDDLDDTDVEAVKDLLRRAIKAETEK